MSLAATRGAALVWTLEIAGAPAAELGPAAPIRAEILIGAAVVGRMTFAGPEGPAAAFRAAHDGTHGVTRVALQRGSAAELRLEAEAGAAVWILGLRGSNRALDGIEQACAERPMAASPANRPDRFPSGVPGDRAAAVGLTRENMAAHLDGMRQAANAANPGLEMGAPINVQAAWLADLDDGWQFLVAVVGPSNFHSGISGYRTLIRSMPSGEDRRRIGPGTSGEALVWFDLGQRHMGWPRLVIQSTRGMEAAFHIWRWDGQTYVHDRQVAP